MGVEIEGVSVSVVFLFETLRVSAVRASTSSGQALSKGGGACFFSILKLLVRGAHPLYAHSRRRRIKPFTFSAVASGNSMWNM